MHWFLPSTTQVSVRDFLLHSCHIEVDESSDIIVYDQSSFSAASVAFDSFLHVLLQKLVHVFRRVFLLSGASMRTETRPLTTTFSPAVVLLLSRGPWQVDSSSFKPATATCARTNRVAVRR